jgi:hypothetical protein
MSFPQGIINSAFLNMNLITSFSIMYFKEFLELSDVTALISL